MRWRCDHARICKRGLGVGRGLGSTRLTAPPVGASMATSRGLWRRLARRWIWVSFEAGGGHVPVLGLDGDMVLEQRPGLRAAAEVPAQLPFLILEAAIDGAGADGQQLTLYQRGDGEAALRPGEPQRQQGPEPGRPRIAGRLPDGREHRQGGSAIGGGPTTSPRLGRGRCALQQLDGVLPVVSGGGTHLRQDLLLRPPRRLSITLADGAYVLLFGCQGHRGLRGPGVGERSVRS